MLVWTCIGRKQPSSAAPLSLPIQLSWFLIRATQQNFFLFSAQTIISLAIYIFSLFYLMFLSDWGLQHLASCPISVRSGGWFWMGGISGAAAPSFMIVCGGAAAFTLLKCFSLHCYWNIHRFSLSCTAVFFFSPSFECRIERLEFPKLQSYSAYDIKLKFGHQNITDNVQSYNEYTYSMATCYMYIYMLTHFMGQI